MNDPIETSLSILPHEKLTDILLALDNLEDIFNACNSSAIFARVCQDDYFWKLRYQQDFGSGLLSKGTTWKEFYQLTIENISSPPMSAGHDHLGVIDRKGQLNMWGYNHDGQLGNGITISTNIPQVVLSNVRQVSCGYKMTGAVTEKGEVYTWGRNSQGSLGIGRYQDRNIMVPRLVKLQKKVNKIYAGSNGSIVITEEGEVYIWGGLFNSLYTNVPIKLDLPPNEKAIDVTTGLNAFAAITKSGKLYMWGDSINYLYLYKNWGNKTSGIYNPDDPEHRKFTQPILIHFSKPIRQISMGRSHFGIVTRNGELWMAGGNYAHQIGEYTPDQEEAKLYRKLIKESKNFKNSKISKKFVERPVILTMIPTLIPIKLPLPVLYYDSRQSISLVKLKGGRILMWGDNYNGQIDHVGHHRAQSDKADNIVTKPVEIKLNHPIVHIVAGGNFTAAITNDDYINLWGEMPRRLVNYS